MRLASPYNLGYCLYSRLAGYGGKIAFEVGKRFPKTGPMAITMQSDATSQTKELPNSASRHVVQFYKDDSVLTDACARFIGAALGAGDAGVVIATPERRERIASRLSAAGVDTAQARQQGRMAMLDAEETLEKFMADASPDAERFEKIIGNVIDQARAGTSNPQRAHVAAFGEMVAILWTEGKRSAAIELEKLWNELAKKHEFSLLCGYPMNGFAHGEDGEAFLEICAEHTGVIPTEAYTGLMGEEEQLRQIASLQQRAEALEAEITARKKAQTELEKSHAKLERMVEKRTALLRELWMRLIHAQDDERRRLSRDLHDNVGQSLAAAKISVAHLSQRVDSRTPEAFRQLDLTLDACLEETRTLSYLLHPPILDEVGLLSAVKWYAEGFANRSGIRVNLEAPMDGARLPLPLETALFRILQEALTNAHRHAKSESVDIRLDLNGANAVLDVRDYGEGIAPQLVGKPCANGEKKGMGLVGIHERVAEFGGKLQIERANPGTRLVASLPLPDVREGS